MNESEALQFGEEVAIAAWRLLPAGRRQFRVECARFVEAMQAAARHGNPWALARLDSYPWVREYDVGLAFTMLLHAGLGWWRPPTYHSFTLAFSARLHQELINDHGEDLDARSMVRNYLTKLGRTVVA